MGIVVSKATQRALKDLCTIEELQGSAIQLGAMDKTEYEDCVQRMTELAIERGIIRPQLCAGIVYKTTPPFVTQRVLPVTKENWDKIKEQVDREIKHMPFIYVVDTLRFRPSQS